MHYGRMLESGSTHPNTVLNVERMHVSTFKPQVGFFALFLLGLEGYGPRLGFEMKGDQVGQLGLKWVKLLPMVFRYLGWLFPL